VLFASRFAGGDNGVVLVFENRLAVVQQAPDERAFAVVNAARCGKAQQLISSNCRLRFQSWLHEMQINHRDTEGTEFF
jgi:hypothetical protein